MAGFGLAIIVLTYRMAVAFVSDRASDTTVADMELAQPKAFLRPHNALFGCILLFGVASGFGLTLNEVMHAPIGVGLAGLRRTAGRVVVGAARRRVRARTRSSRSRSCWS